MRHAVAPMTLAYRRGGGKEKARIGITPEKVTNAGRGGCFSVSFFAAVAQLDRAQVS